MNLMPDLSSPRSTYWRMKIGPMPAGTNAHERVRFCVRDVLQRRREIVARQRHAQGFDHLAAVRLESLFERGLHVDPGRVVRDHRDHGLDAVRRRPIGERNDRLRHREAGAHDIGRALGDDRGRRHHHDFRNLGLGGDRRRRQRAGREPKTGKEGDLVVHHQLLGEPLGHVGIAGVVADDQFDLLAGNRVAVLLHVELGAGGELLAGRG